jgi:hypothetical protein
MFPPTTPGPVKPMTGFVIIVTPDETILCLPGIGMTAEKKN